MTPKPRNSLKSIPRKLQFQTQRTAQHPKRLFNPKTNNQPKRLKHLRLKNKPSRQKPQIPEAMTKRKFKRIKSRKEHRRKLAQANLTSDDVKHQANKVRET